MRPRRSSVIASIALTGLWVLVACDSSEPQPSPKTSNSAAAERKTGDVKDVADEDEDDDDEADEDADASFNFGGAKVGDGATKDDVKKCHESERFFDRFDGEVGSCTRLRLARVDCTLSGVKKKLSSKQRSQLKDALEGSYKGWLLDQCLDCADGDDPLCQSASGAEQVGTKLYFVKEDGAALKGKSLLIPARFGRKD